MSGTASADGHPRSLEVFLSYASSDLDRAEALHARLVKAGFTVWFDRARLAPACDWHREIEAACEAARVMLPLVTPRWKQSEWARYETYAHAAVVPVLAEGDPADTLTPPLRRLNAIALDPLAAGEPQWQALFAALRSKLAEPVPEQEPRIVDLPYPANPFFTGRENDLLRLHEELHTAPVAALTQGRVRALAAMGGIGKTTLANEYARRYWRLYPQILWIDARLGYQTEFARLFDRLFPARKDVDLKADEKARQALAELNGTAERLLVIDNVLDAESVRPWLPRRASSGCRTLITSRFADWPQAAGVRAIQLYVLEPEPARTFLVNRTGRIAEGGERTACDALARALGYLPLALEQAAAYIAAPGAGVDFAGYLRLYNAAMKELLGRGVLGSTDYPDPVIATWQTTVARLSSESRAVLRMCGWLADTAIPRELVTGGSKKVMALAIPFGPVAPLEESPAAAELRMDDALAGLARYSMILDTTDAGFRVHGLVQAVERMQAAKDGHDAEARDAALERLTDTFPDARDEPSAWPLCRQLMPHQQTMVERFTSDASDRTVARLLLRAGAFRLGSGEAAAALLLYQRASEANERALGAEHPDTLRSMSDMALCLNEIGDAAGAAASCRRVLEAQERTLGPEHHNTLTSVNNLAYFLRALGTADSALPLYRRSLEAHEKVLGREHPETLTAMDNLAGCLKSLGDATSAEPVFRRALELKERTLGPEHPDTLISVHNLADCLDQLGHAASALPLYQRALKAAERVLGPEHPATLSTVNNLALCLRTLGDAAAALQLCRRALDGKERVLGSDHPSTFTGVNSLALCLETIGDAKSALPFYRRALEGRERLLGPDHPATLTSVSNLAGCLETLGDTVAAVPLYRRALEAKERVLGPEHPDTLVTLNNLGGCLYLRGDSESARPLLHRALKSHERVLGPEHPDTLRILANFASCLTALGEPASALPLFRRALEGCERAYGPEHPGTLRIVNDLASCLETLGQIVQAEALRRPALDAQIRALGPDHPTVLSAQNNLAAGLRQGGHPDLAEPYARQCADTSVRVLGPERSQTMHRRNNLALTLLMLKRTDEARRLLAETWAVPAPPRTVVTPAIAFLGIVAALLDGRPIADPVGRLKTLLDTALEEADGVAPSWNVGYLLDWLQGDLPSDSAAFLRALLAAINDRSLTPTLDRFPSWETTASLPLDTPWPDGAGMTR